MLLIISELLYQAERGCHFAAGETPRRGQYRGDEGVLDLAVRAEQLTQIIRLGVPGDVADVPAQAAKHTASEQQQTDARTRHHR
jgi:hypothetical protein